MTKSELDAFEIIKASLYGEKIHIEDDEELWSDIFEILKKHNLLALTYSVFENNQGNRKTELKEVWKNIAFNSELIQMIKNREVLKLLNEGYEQGIEWLVFKGVALAELYPTPQMRISCDADIYVNENQIEAARCLLEKNGFVYNEKRSKKNVYNYYKGDIHAIELHTRLWEDYDGEPIHILEGLKLTQKSSLRNMQIQKVDIKTLGYTDHLIYQMFHIIKHFSLEGVGIRYIVDITLYINKYIDQIDMDIFWVSMDKLRYAKFCNLFFSFAHKYFGLTQKVLRTEYSEENLDADVLEDIIQVGKISKDDVASWKVLHMLSPYMMWERSKPKTKGEIFKNIMFPKKEILFQQYPYSQHFNFLLPVAWVNRVGRIIYDGCKKGNFSEDVSFKMSKVNHRLDLMARTGLINNEK